MKSIWCLALALAALAVVAPARAAAPLAAYGSLPTIEQIAISPSGRLLAVALVKDEQRTIVIEDLALKKPVNGVKLGDAKLRGIEWAGDDHLIFVTSFTGGAIDFAIGQTEWFVATDFNLAAHKLAPLLGDSNLTLNAVQGMPSVRVIDGKPYVLAQGIYFGGRTEEEAGNMRMMRSELALYQISLDTDRSTRLSSDDAEATGYMVDADGDPLAETLYDATAKQWALKVWRDRQWRTAQTKTAAIETPELLGLGRDGHSILVSGLGEKVNELREISADGATVSDPLPGPQSGSFLRDPATHRLIGVVNLEGDALVYHFYDDADAQQWAAIQASFPGQRVELLSSSDDRQKLVLHVDSATEGPGYALVDLTAHSSQWLGAEYPGLTAADVSPVQPVRFKAADGLVISGYLTLPNGRDAKNLPLVVFPHGGPAARDAPGFDWWAQAMASRGYAVLQVNYRGSDGLGRSFLEAGFGEWGRKMQTDLSDGVRYLAARGPSTPSVSASSAPATAATRPWPARRSIRASTAAPSTCRARPSCPSSSPGARTRPATTRRSATGMRYMGASALNDPHLTAISPADLADKVTIPILIIHGKDDTVVPFEQSQMMADALAKAGKPYQLVVLNHEDHWLSRGDTRLQMLQATMDFLQKNNPAD